MERLRIQQEELERCCTLQEQLNAALNEIDKLKQKSSSSNEMGSLYFSFIFIHSRY